MKPILDRIKSMLKKYLYSMRVGWKYVEAGEMEKADLWIAISPLEYDLPVLGRGLAGAGVTAASAIFFGPEVAVGGALAGAMNDAASPKYGKFIVKAGVYDAGKLQLIAETEQSSLYTDDPINCAGTLAGQIAGFLAGNQ
jgi:hypothetical protein